MIESLGGNCVYYGSTIQTLSIRLAKHRSDIKIGKTPSSKNVLKYDDARILLVALFPCNSRMELEAKEATYIRNNDCVNKQIPQRTPKEWYQENKEVVSKQMKQYRQDNKEVIKEYGKIYRQDNKEEITIKHKKYVQKNKEPIKQYKKQYFQNNKDKIMKQTLKKCLCDCGKEYTHCHYKRHTQSKNHQFYQKTYNFIIS